MYFDVLREVRQSVKIPIAVKLGPYFSAIAFMARRLAEAGANGLVFFNRFYQPDIDLEKLEVAPNLVLSTSTAMRLPLRWVAILYGRVNADFAITNGVHTHEDVLKAIMAGASATQIAAELLEKGPGRIPDLLAEVTRWMEQHEYHSVAQLRGSMSQKSVAEPAAFERANYMKVLQSGGRILPVCLVSVREPENAPQNGIAGRPFEDALGLGRGLEKLSWISRFRRGSEGLRRQRVRAPPPACYRYLRMQMIPPAEPHRPQRRVRCRLRARAPVRVPYVHPSPLRPSTNAKLAPPPDAPSETSPYHPCGCHPSRSHTGGLWQRNRQT